MTQSRRGERLRLSQWHEPVRAGLWRAGDSEGLGLHRAVVAVLSIAMSASPKPFRREDRPGHLDPEHVKRLRSLSAEEHRTTSSDPDPRTVFRSDGDGGFAEELGELTVLAATTGDDAFAEDVDPDVVEERGGPFVGTTFGDEMADGVDESNPLEAEREPFPTT